MEYLDIAGGFVYILSDLSHFSEGGGVVERRNDAKVACARYRSVLRCNV